MALLAWLFFWRGSFLALFWLFFWTWRLSYLARDRKAKESKAEWVEEGDYLIRTDYLMTTCGGKDLAERMQTEREQRPKAAAVFLDWNGLQASPDGTGFHRQRHG